jgi:hypothetical protein
MLTTFVYGIWLTVKTEEAEILEGPVEKFDITDAELGQFADLIVEILSSCYFDPKCPQFWSECSAN